MLGFIDSVLMCQMFNQNLFIEDNAIVDVVNSLDVENVTHANCSLKTTLGFVDGVSRKMLNCSWKTMLGDIDGVSMYKTLNCSLKTMLGFAECIVLM